MRVLVVNGVNLNLLGTREPSIYGLDSLKNLQWFIILSAEKLGIEICCQQSNSELEIIDLIHASKRNGFSAILINPGAYSHYSIAILDALRGVSLPYAVVHLSEPLSREPFRHVDVVASGAEVVVTGKGFAGYEEALIKLSKI